MFDSVSTSTRCTSLANSSARRREWRSVHHVQRISGLPHVQPRQRAPRSADRIETAILAGFEHRQAAQRLLDELFPLFSATSPKYPRARGRPAGGVKPCRTRILWTSTSSSEPPRDRRQCRRCVYAGITPSAVSSASREPERTSMSTFMIRSACRMNERPFLASRQAAWRSRAFFSLPSSGTARGSA